MAATLCLAIGGAEAVPITFDANYVTTSGQNCIRTFCVPIVPGGTFQKTFVLDSAQLLVNGSYDVTSSLTPAFTFPPGVTSSTTQYHAIVLAGLVKDLAIDFSYNASNTNPIIGTTTTSSSFLASNGGFTTSDSSFNDGIPTSSSGNSAGTYTISQVPPAPTPEPASLLLFASGLAGLAVAGRGRRKGELKPLAPFPSPARR